MQKVLNRIFSDLKRGENIDLVLIVILAFTITILDIFDITSDNLISSITLTTLGLIAFGLLITRHKIEEIYKRDDISDTVKFSRNLRNELDENIINAQEIWLLGITLNSAITNYFSILESKAKTGIKIKVIIVDLDLIDIDVVVDRFSRGGEAQHFKSSSDQTFNQLKKIRDNASNKNNVEIRFINFIPSISLYLFPNKKNGGKLIGEIYCYKSTKGSIPRFLVEEYKQFQWYQHFIEQYGLFWKNSRNALPD